MDTPKSNVLSNGCPFCTIKCGNNYCPYDINGLAYIKYGNLSSTDVRQGHYCRKYVELKKKSEVQVKTDIDAGEA